MFTVTDLGPTCIFFSAFALVYTKYLSNPSQFEKKNEIGKT